jgi:hypothetical protein
MFNAQCESLNRMRLPWTKPAKLRKAEGDIEH